MRVSPSQKEHAREFLALHRMKRPFVLANCWGCRDRPPVRTGGLSRSRNVELRDRGGARAAGWPTDRPARNGEPRGAPRLPGRPADQRRHRNRIRGNGRRGRPVRRGRSFPQVPWESTSRTAREIRVALSSTSPFSARRSPPSARWGTRRDSIPSSTRARTRSSSRRATAASDCARRSCAAVLMRRSAHDCVFVPDMGDLDAAAMRQLVDAIGTPLNVVAGASTPPMSTLEEIGIARVSLGPRVMRAGLGLFREMAREILDRREPHEG